MKFWLRVGISFCLIVLALFIISLLKVISLPRTSYFVLIGGGSISLIIGIGLILFSLLQVSKKVEREKLTDEEIFKQLEEGLVGVKPDYIESRFLIRAGAIAAYLKKRGKNRGRVTEKGQYLAYERWAAGVRRTATELINRYPELRDRSAVVYLLSRIDVYALSNFLEDFSHLYEGIRKFRVEYVPKKALKSLELKLKPYVRD